MKHIIFFIFIVVFLNAACLGQNGKSMGSILKVDTSKISSKMEGYIKGYTDLDLFSGVVIIAYDGKPIYIKPFGLADRKRNIRVTPNTKFLIGSMNKTFTQVVILQLVSEGRLKLSDKLVEYIAGFQQPDAMKITVEHLLHHRSGFGDYFGPEYFNLPYDRKNIQGITDLLKDRSLVFAPGAGEQYSNAGYILLGAIIEKVTGQSYSKNVNERVIRKLNLKDIYTEHIDAIPDKSIGYLKTINGVEDNLKFITEPRSDGGFWATASDILIFYRNFFYGNTLLSEKMKEPLEFFKRLNQVPPGKAIGMAGGMNGINTIYSEMPNEKISIVVMANMDEPVAEKIASGIKQIITCQTPDPVAMPVKLAVYNEYKSNGIQSIKDNFESLTSNFNHQEPKDAILNMLGYDLLLSGHLKEALELFKLNTELFPNIANCWDSYGEALLKGGNEKAALAAYEKALSINPNIRSSQKAVKMLTK